MKNFGKNAKREWKVRRSAAANFNWAKNLTFSMEGLLNRTISKFVDAVISWPEPEPKVQMLASLKHADA